MLAAIAASTSRIEFGPLVACTAFHNPALLAKQAATIDEISGGRLILGLGAGWNETEFRAFGIPFDHRVDRFEEAFTIIRTLLQEGAIDFDGRFYQARHCELIPRGPRPNGPPLMIGSNGPRMLRIAVPHAQAWNTWFADIDNAPEGVAPLRDAVDAACRDTGTDPGTIERTAAVHVRFPDGVGRIQGSYASAPPPPLEGRPEQMAERMRAYAREGVGHVQLVIDPITRGSIEAFAPVPASAGWLVGEYESRVDGPPHPHENHAAMAYPVCGRCGPSPRSWLRRPSRPRAAARRRAPRRPLPRRHS
jgi:alkanesulfonate monooxygenase SsuD/methylene tetrahydromethanopterin reductase-like flavin-dependent oxidoreductase (luciferase family)